MVPRGVCQIRVPCSNEAGKVKKTKKQTTTKKDGSNKRRVQKPSNDRDGFIEKVR